MRGLAEYFGCWRLIRFSAAIVARKSGRLPQSVEMTLTPRGRDFEELVDLGGRFTTFVPAMRTRFGAGGKALVGLGKIGSSIGRSLPAFGEDFRCFDAGRLGCVALRSACDGSLVLAAIPRRLLSLDVVDVFERLSSREVLAEPGPLSFLNTWC